MSHSAITVNQVTVTYRNGHTALRDATFQVPGGSIAAADSDDAVGMVTQHHHAAADAHDGHQNGYRSERFAE